MATNSNIFLTGHKILIQICILKPIPKYGIFFGLVSSLRKGIYVKLETSTIFYKMPHDKEIKLHMTLNLIFDKDLT